MPAGGSELGTIHGRCLAPTSNRALDTLLRPKSVAEIETSDDPDQIGGRPVHGAHAGGYKGQIYLVNSKRKIVQGVSSYLSMRNVPEAVECAIVAVPAPVVAKTVADCTAQGIKTTIVISSGFAKALSRLSVFAAVNAERPQSIDISPAEVLSKGALELNAVIVPRSSTLQTCETD